MIYNNIHKVFTKQAIQQFKENSICQVKPRSCLKASKQQGNPAEIFFNNSSIVNLIYNWATLITIPWINAYLFFSCFIVYLAQISCKKSNKRKIIMLCSVSNSVVKAGMNPGFWWILDGLFLKNIDQSSIKVYIFWCRMMRRS